jgi:hypothetical protein
LAGGDLMVKFLLNDILLVEKYDDLGKVKGCSREDENDFVECEECNYKYGCPAKESI